MAASSSSLQNITQRRLPAISDVDITELYCPPPSVDVIADIVLVHGLKGHPKVTWPYGKELKAQPTSASGSKPPKKLPFGKLFEKSKESKAESASDDRNGKTRHCFWPYDLLPNAKITAETRILVYGYDSNPTHFYRLGTNRMTITQHAEDLMHKVAAVRYECRGRPLIFNAHSLGGILIKGALIESQHMTEQPAYNDLRAFCRAIVFMGTPHLGADTASWGKTSWKDSPPDSETLYIITRRFNEILNQNIPSRDKIQICSVQEGLGMSSAKGVGSKVVPDYSSKFNCTDIEQSFFNQTANHMNMCKFPSADDQAYKNVPRVLQGYCSTIKEQQRTEALGP